MKQNFLTLPDSFGVRFLLITAPIFALMGCSFSQSKSKKIYHQSSEKKYDVIIVPGVPFENGVWSRTMKGRVYWAKHLFDKGIAKNIMFSGAAVYTPYCEAEIMALYGEAIGIPKQHIFTETKAEHSTENIYYSYHKAKKMGFNTIALATDPFQSKMLRRFIRKKVSKDVAIIPIVFDKLAEMHNEMTDPTIAYQKAFVDAFIPLPERESRLKRLQGTRGKNIDYVSEQQLNSN